VEMEVDSVGESSKPAAVVDLLRRFLAVQENRAAIYARLKKGFTEYLRTGADRIYQQFCSQITNEFNDCSKQVIEMESIFGARIIVGKILFICLRQFRPMRSRSYI